MKYLRVLLMMLSMQAYAVDYAVLCPEVQQDPLSVGYVWPGTDSADYHANVALLESLSQQVYKTSVAAGQVSDQFDSGDWSGLAGNPTLQDRVLTVLLIDGNLDPQGWRFQEVKSSFQAGSVTRQALEGFAKHWVARASQLGISGVTAGDVQTCDTWEQ